MYLAPPIPVITFIRTETSKLREAETLESLMARLASLYVEKKDAEEQLVRERKRADLAKEETWKATKDVQEVQRRAEREKVEKRGEQLMNLALRCKLSQCVAQSEVRSIYTCGISYSCFHCISSLQLERQLDHK